MHDVFAGWTEALRELGEEVVTFGLDTRLTFYDSALVETGIYDDTGHPGVRKAMTREQAIRLAADGILSTCYSWWPDVVLLVSAFFTPPYLLDMMRGRGHKIVLLHTEQPYQADEQLVRAAHADINLLNDPSGIEAYRDLGMPAQYVPHAYREKIHYPAAPGTEPVYDLAFVGTGFPSRVKFFEQMKMDGLNVRLAGPWLNLPEDSPLRDWTATDLEDCVDNEDTAEIYRQSACGINFYRRESEAAHEGEGVACGPREIELAACGTYFLRDPRPESDELFPMLPSFTSPEEASELLRWALAHPRERAAAAAAARAAVEDRTFTANAKSLLRLLDRQPARM